MNLLGKSAQRESDKECVPTWDAFLFCREVILIPNIKERQNAVNTRDPTPKGRKPRPLKLARRQLTARGRMLLVQKNRQQEPEAPETAATGQVEQAGRAALQSAARSTPHLTRRMAELGRRKLRERTAQARREKQEFRQRENVAERPEGPVLPQPEQQAPMEGNAVRSPWRKERSGKPVERPPIPQPQGPIPQTPHSVQRSDIHTGKSGNLGRPQQGTTPVLPRGKPALPAVREKAPGKSTVEKAKGLLSIREKPIPMGAAARSPKPVPRPPGKAGVPAIRRGRALAQRRGQQKLVRQAKAAAKSAATVTKRAAALVARAAAALGSALAGLVGGGVLALLLCGVLLVGALVASPFGIFFSGEDLNGDGRTMAAVMREINTEFSRRLGQIEAANPYDELDREGTSASWKDVLAVYTVAHSTESEEPMEVATITPEKEQFLRQVFWDMNQITYDLEVVSTPGEEGEEPTETRILHIRIQGLTRQEAAEKYGFTDRQTAQLAELTGSDMDDAWQHLLYGSFAGSGDLVAVALSQVGNGGSAYWSWYGFSSRVEWCAIFVSWCAEQCGYLNAGVMPKFAGCGAGVNWFQVRGQWLPGNETPRPGMVIFFKWYGSDASISDHVGIVERVENDRVYTIEGNSGDLVRQNSYPIGYGEILGYGVAVE